MASTTRQTKVSARRTGHPQVPKKSSYALLSVFDKTGIVELARGLVKLGYQIIATGGTAKALTDAKVQIVPIQEITGNPESFDGRMKTISFQIESGILYDRSNKQHVKEAEELAIKPIDIVVCNLYPFEQTIANERTTLPDAVEQIDVGGPTMVRSAAKNFKSVLVLVSPQDYAGALEALKSDKLMQTQRQAYAAKAFDHLSFYDGQVARFLRNDMFPEELALPGRRSLKMRYGENMHQESFVYFEPNTNSPLRKLTYLSGRQLSYVNFTDIVAGLEAVRFFNEPAAVIIKHNTPCGIAMGKTIEEALRRAVIADAESAFGGAVVLNKPLDLPAARTFASFKEEDGILIDIVAAPSIPDDAKDFIRTIRKSTGIYTFGDIPDHRSNNTHVRFFDGGYLLQNWDDTMPDVSSWEVVSKKKPTKSELEQMRIAWQFISRIRSNSILVIDRHIPMTRGIGSGQTSRVRAVKIAVEQAGLYAKGAILASDSFFPFADSVKTAAEHGIGGIVQQGGSLNDQASIDAADSAGMSMVFTKERKFWH